MAADPTTQEAPYARAVSTLLYRERRIFSLVVLMIVALGSLAASTIGRQEDPTLTNLFATVLTPFPGANPERVESLVTEVIEAELETIPEIKELSSVSRTGISSVQISLSEFVPEDQLEQIWSEIRDALGDVAPLLPEGAAEPDFDNDRTDAFTAIFALERREGSDASIALISRFADRLADLYRQMSGTKFVQVYGEATEEILVEIDQLQLSFLGLTPDQVAAAVRSADAKVRAGRVRGAANDYLLEVEGEIRDLDRIRAIPIVTDAARAQIGAPIVRLGDVASIRRAERQPPEEIALAKGERAVLVAVRMTPNRQVDAWMERVKEVADEFRGALPDGVELRQTFDQSAYTTERLTGLAQNMLIGVSLVVAVLLITLGWRAALIVALILPLTSLLSIFILKQIGIVIHQMSVTGLIVALGLLVDGAIVMTDEIRRRLNGGMSRLQAIGLSVRRLAVPLLSSTVTTVLAFMPMALLPGPAGDFVGNIAISVIVMLCSSLLLALTVTPAVAGFILKDRAAGGSPEDTGLFWRVYGGLLRLSLRWRVLAAAVAATPAIVGFLASPTLVSQFFPETDRNQFHVQIYLPLGSSIEATEETALRIDDILRGQDDITQVQWVIGGSAPGFYYNLIPQNDRKPDFGQALVTTTSPEATERLVPALQRELDIAAPEARVLVRGLIQGPPVTAPLEMRIMGPELAELSRIGEEARRRMAALPEVTHAWAQQSDGAPKLALALDEDKVRLAGLTLGEVARQLETLIEGVEGGSLVEGSEQLPVRVRISTADRAAADRVAEIRILPPDAASQVAGGADAGVPLAALGDFVLEPAQSEISRFDGERANTIRGFLQLGVLPEAVLNKFRADLAAEPLDLPPGYRYEWGGDNDARNDTVGNLLSSVVLVLALTVATILLTFNSWRLSIVTFVVAVLSAGLSMLALAIFQYPFGIQALIGVIGSIGVSINAAIIIMTGMQEDPAAAEGDLDAIQKVVTGSTRHIVSTTLTTFGGFLPLILAGGGFWPPFAMAVAGGVLLSTVVSLFFVPPVYSLVTGRPRRDRAPTAAPLAAAPA